MSSSYPKAPPNPFRAKTSIPDGYMLVPIEPTWEMQNNASEKTDVNSFLDIQAVWKAMLSAAPKANI